jgi:hypothetical protein
MRSYEFRNTHSQQRARGEVAPRALFLTTSRFLLAIPIMVIPGIFRASIQFADQFPCRMGHGHFSVQDLPAVYAVTVHRAIAALIGLDDGPVQAYAGK